MVTDSHDHAVNATIGTVALRKQARGRVRRSGAAKAIVRPAPGLRDPRDSDGDLCEARGVEARGCWVPTSLTCSRRDGYPRRVDAPTTYERNDISRLQASGNVNGATGARKPSARGVLERAQRAGSLARRRQLRSEGPARWLTVPREPARARAGGYDGGVDGAFAGGLRAWAGMIEVLTSWTSWTTSHNASRGRRQTLLVHVDYGRKATSHKSPFRSRGPTCADHTRDRRLQASFRGVCYRQRHESLRPSDAATVSRYRSASSSGVWIAVVS